MLSSLFLMVLLVLAAGAAAAEEPVLEPISREAYADDLIAAGLRNGAMPAIRMIDVGNCRLERDAAYTLSLMLEAARADGVDLIAHECYRSFGVQASAYDRRCPLVAQEVVEVDPATGEERIVTIRRSRTCSGPPIARAGYSNHGWGRAVDFGTGRRVLGCRDTAFRWLQENAARFGWVHPPWAECGRPSREPWHWEWGGLQVVLPLAGESGRDPAGLAYHAK